MKHDENKIHINIVEQHYLYFPHVILTHPANQGRSPQEGAKLKRMGVRAGVSDLLLWWEGSCGAVEIKAGKGKESPNQGTFGYMLKQLGHHYGVVRSWKEYYHLLLSWGVTPMHTCSIFREANLLTWEDKRQLVQDFFKP